METDILVNDYILFKQHGIERNTLIIKTSFSVFCNITQLEISVKEVENSLLTLRRAWGGFSFITQ